METVSNLFKQNGDFEEFLQEAKIDYESKRIHRSEYDEVLKDIRTYTRNKLKIRQMDR